MSSDLKVTNIKHASSGSNNLVLGSDGNVSITNTLSAGTIGTGVTINAGSNVSGIGQLVGMSVGSTSSGSDGNDVTVDVNKNYVFFLSGWHITQSFIVTETWTATGNGTSHTFTEKLDMGGSYMQVSVGSGGNGTAKADFSGPYGYAQMLVFEQGTGFDIT